MKRTVFRDISHVLRNKKLAKFCVLFRKTEEQAKVRMFRETENMRTLFRIILRSGVAGEISF